MSLAVGVAAACSAVDISPSRAVVGAPLPAAFGRTVDVGGTIGSSLARDALSAPVGAGVAGDCPPALSTGADPLAAASAALASSLPDVAVAGLALVAFLRVLLRVVVLAVFFAAAVFLVVARGARVVRLAVVPVPAASSGAASSGVAASDAAAEVVRLVVRLVGVSLARRGRAVALAAPGRPASMGASSGVVPD